jgi:hypothetical protein
MFSKSNCRIFGAFLAIILIISLQLAIRCLAQEQTGTGSTGRVTSLPTLTPTVPALTGTATDASTVRPTSPPRPVNTSTVRPRFPSPVGRGARTGTSAGTGRGTGTGAGSPTVTDLPRGTYVGTPSGTVFTGTAPPSVTPNPTAVPTGRGAGTGSGTGGYTSVGEPPYIHTGTSATGTYIATLTLTGERTSTGAGSGRATRFATSIGTLLPSVAPTKKFTGLPTILPPLLFPSGTQVGTGSGTRLPTFRSTFFPTLVTTGTGAGLVTKIPTLTDLKTSVGHLVPTRVPTMKIPGGVASLLWQTTRIATFSTIAPKPTYVRTSVDIPGAGTGTGTGAGTHATPPTWVPRTGLATMTPTLRGVTTTHFTGQFLQEQATRLQQQTTRLQLQQPSQQAITRTPTHTTGLKQLTTRTPTKQQFQQFQQQQHLQHFQQPTHLQQQQQQHRR